MSSRTEHHTVDQIDEIKAAPDARAPADGTALIQLFAENRRSAMAPV